MVIRQETEHDLGAARALVTAAFAAVPFSDGTEADYLDAVRKTGAFLPALSLVAEENGVIVGHVLLYQTKIRCKDRSVTQLVLSPLSVHPSHARQGIGRQLIAAACKKARAMGYRAVFLCGDIEYYSKSGFVPARRYGVYHVRDTERQADWCLAKELEPGCLQDMQGLIDIE